MNDATTTTTLPADFASRWVTAMLTAVVGSTAESNDGAAESLGDLAVHLHRMAHRGVPRIPRHGWHQRPAVRKVLSATWPAAAPPRRRR
jgi:hypothetical protein